MLVSINVKFPTTKLIEYLFSFEFSSWIISEFDKLCLNLSKTENNPWISVGGKLLNRVTVTDSLWDHIDQFLSWDFYIEKLTKKISSGIGAISRLKPFVCKDTLISVYNTLVQTYFDYCCGVWDPFGSNFFSKLQRLQNRAARIFMGYPNEHGRGLMYKIIHGFAPTA